jgi:hypothetical protein
VGTYGLATGQWALVAGEYAFALGGLTVVARLLPARTAAARLLAVAALVVGVCAVLGPGAGLVLGAAGSCTIRVAQIRAVLRSGNAAGVSVPTWLLLAAASAAWTAVGVLRADAVLVATTAVGGLASLAVVVTCAAVSRRTR